MDLKYNNEVFNIEISENTGQIIADINGERKSFVGRVISPGVFSVFCDNKYINIYSAEDDNHVYINFDGESIVFDKVKEEEKSFDGDSEESADREEIKAPMPGSVVKVLVEKEQKVCEGDVLIIVEAMKMETSLYASIDGIVTEVNVEAGEQVDSDKIMIVVEREVLSVEC